MYTRKPLGPEEARINSKCSLSARYPYLLRRRLQPSPLNETGDFLPTDLVELRKLDPTIKLDIRYATTKHLFGTVFYSQRERSCSVRRRSRRSR